MPICWQNNCWPVLLDREKNELFIGPEISHALYYKPQRPQRAQSNYKMRFSVLSVFSVVNK